MPLRAALAASALAAAATLPQGAPVEPRVTDAAAELRGFVPAPPAWSGEVVNAVLGEGSPGQVERRSGFLAAPERWALVDYVDRAYNYATHGWLARRGTAAEHYGFNEYQETLHLRPEAALALFGERGLARGPMGELVIDPLRTETGRSYIADPIEPRWSALLAYDMAASPLLGDAISQDNLGVSTWSMGPSALGSYSDAAARGFAAWRAARGEPPVAPIRSYLREHFTPSIAALSPYLRPAPADARRASSAARALCADPVFADFQLYRQAANLAVWKRLYTDLRSIAARAGRDFDAHGNLSGSLLGPDPYPLSLAPLVDLPWFESSGLAEYDQFQHGWWNANGALRMEFALGAGAPDRPALFLANPQKKTADLMLHELGEISAGGGVPLANPDLLAQSAPEALAALASLLELRDRHRAVYQARGRVRIADVALLYSVATALFDQCVPNASSSDSPPQNDFGSAARALEDGHVPYDVVVLRHPDLAPGAREPDLSRYKLVLAPSLESLADADLARLTRFLKGGGTLAVLGKLGVRDERNRARGADALAALRAAGKVKLLLGGASFPETRSSPNTKGRALGAQLVAELAPLLPGARVSGDLPQTTWLKLWHHAGGFASAHFVSYALDYATGAARPAPPVTVRLRLPGDVRPERAQWLVPGEPERELSVRLAGGAAEVSLPALRVYGVLVLGPAGAEARASALARGDQRLARARRAGTGASDLDARLGRVAALRRGDPAAYDSAAGALLRALSDERERAYLDGIARLGDAGDPVALFAFGQRADLGPWRAVRADSAYERALGFGWLPRDDDSSASPEERDYAGAIGQDPDALTSVPMASLYWPYLPSALPAPVSSALVSGPARTFRLDLPDGDYRVNLVAANGGWPRMNLLVSGLVTANGRPVLLDTPLDRGALLRRSFTSHVAGGALELRLGGPTGFGIAALQVEKASHSDPEPLAAGGVRRWQLSPRHPNPDWLPLDRLELPEAEPASEALAAPEGIPLVDLGTLAQAEIGDVVVARAEIQRAGPGSAELRVGASSAARVYLNGALVLDLANVKGVEADEGRARVALRAGANRLEVRLERFWERRWLFFASVL